MVMGKAACCGDTDPLYKIAYNVETQEANLYCVECGSEGHAVRVDRNGNATLSIAVGVDREVSQYVEALQHVGFSEWQTGGGCTAMGQQLERYYVLVTNDDLSVPQDGEPVSLGVYPSDDCYDCEPVESFIGPMAVSDMLALIERYRAKYNQPPDGRRTCFFCDNVWGKCSCDKPVCAPFDFEDYVWIREPNVSVCTRYYVDPVYYYGAEYQKAQRRFDDYRCDHGCKANAVCEDCGAPMCDHSHEIHSGQCLRCDQKDKA